MTKIKCKDCECATFKKFGIYCEVLGLPMNENNIHLCKKRKKREKGYFSFDKFSLIKGKKYKNLFKKEIIEIFTDDKGNHYLVTKDGSVYKHYDELKS